MALIEALTSLPNDYENPAPLCARINQLLDVVMPLTQREDLSPEDQAVLLEFCQADHRLENLTLLIHALDKALGAEHSAE